MPTWAATARAARSLSPVSSTGSRPERAQPRDRLGAGRLDGVGDDEHGPDLAVPAGQRRRCGRAPRPRPCAPRRLGGERACAQSASSRSRPGETAWPSTTPCTPSPSRLAKPSTGAQRSDSCARRRRRWPGRSGARDASSSAPTRRSTSSRVDAVGRDDVDERHAAGGDGAGLVEHDRVDLAGGLEHLGALDEDAELGAAAGADQQRGGRGQAERARAGDDQHGDGGGERGRRRSRRCPSQKPRVATASTITTGRTPPRSGRPAAAPAPCRTGPR